MRLNKQVQQVRTACPYCGVGCGVIASRSSGESDNGSTGSHQIIRKITISGDPDHPANAGKLCSKGMALADTFVHTDRLTHPRINGERVSWDEASSHIAQTFKKTIEEHGPESVAFYVSGQLLTEDYYVANKFVKGWLGTANIDTNSRLCMASSVAGHKRAFGADTVPGCYEDLDLADLIILVGSNLAWCHPVIYQRIQAAKTERPDMKIVVIDPRRSITADNADLHLGIKPDGDALLFNALLLELSKRGLVNQQYVNDHVSGYDDAMAAASACCNEDIADQLGISTDDLKQFLDLAASCEKTVTVYSQGVNQSRAGTDKVNAIINCHLATGRIGKPGMGPFSITGQPNAMGGREVGGLATMLACHRDLDNPEHQSQVQRFWNSPRIANKVGLTAVDMFRAVDRGEIKAIWIMATNPVDSLPEADSVASALAKCPFVVVSDVTSQSDTVHHAHVLLPAQAFGEKDGTVTNSERRISRQRRINEPVGEAKPDWWAIAKVAMKMGFERSFDFASPAKIFAEYASLSAFENNGRFDFDIGACADIAEHEYEDMQPFQWLYTSAPDNKTIKFSAAPVPEYPPKVAMHPNASPIRFFAKGNFYTPDKRARMIAVVPPAPGNDQLCDTFPLILNTGRIRDQWHTMTRTGYIPRLMSHRAEPFIEISASDALIHGIRDADIVNIKSPTGAVLARAMISERQAPGQVFAPMHWTDQFSGKARIDTLVEALTDPVSRQPASKNQAVSIQRFAANAFAFMLTRSAPELKEGAEIEYWATSPVENGWRTELASSLSMARLCQVLQDKVWQTKAADAKQAPITLEKVEYLQAGKCRFAWFDTNNRLHAMLYLSTDTVEVSRSWASGLLQEPASSNVSRSQLMAGRAPGDQPDKGAIVCSCFGIGDKQIASAVKSGSCSSTADIGKALSAGTNCGSCRNEIEVIVRRLHKQGAIVPAN